MNTVSEILPSSVYACKSLFFFQSCLQSCYIYWHLSDRLGMTPCILPPLALWIIQMAIWWSILHIRLAACVSVLDRIPRSHPCPFFFISSSRLSMLPPSLPALSPSILTLYSPLPSCLHYLSLHSSIPLCASVLFLIAPFIKEYK